MSSKSCVEFSCFIIAKNEETRIAKAINSVKKISQEVIVIDSGSTDNTVEIAKSLGAKVVFNEWPGYVMQKSFGEALCQNDWVLNIDADEELSLELQHEIEHLFAANMQESYLAYSIDFVIMHRNDSSLRFLAPSNRFIRLYNRKSASFANTQGNSTTHDSVKFNDSVTDPRVYKFNAPAYHRSGMSISQLVDKANFYSTEQARDIVNKKRKIGNFRLLFEFFIVFVKSFIWRRYFVFGIDGFIDSAIFAFARFLRLAKARENRNNR